MRLAHLTDLHIIDGPRLGDHAETLGHVVDEIVAMRPDVVLLTGDLAGRTVPHRTTPRERAVLFPALVRLARVAPVAILAGNHDHDIDIDGLAHLDGDWPIMVLKGAGTQVINTASGPCALYWLAYPTKRWLLAGEAATGVREAQTAVQEKLALLTSLWGGKVKRARARTPELPHVFLGHVQIGGCVTSGGEVLAGNEIELQRQHLEALGVDYGALGHIHKRQEIAPRCWYAGSLWRNTHAETDAFKGWHLVDIAPRLSELEARIPEPPPEHGGHHYLRTGGQQPMRVVPFPSGCRRFVTLDYRWGSPNDGEPPRWERDGLRALLIGAAVQTQTPTAWNTGENREAVRQRIDGAEVRMRLIVSQQHAASSAAPWAREIDKVRQLGAHDLKIERLVEPVLRVRAPAVAAATTVAAKVRAYWTTLAAQPGDEDQAAALAQLQELLEMDDEAIAGTRQAIASNPTGDRSAETPPTASA